MKMLETNLQLEYTKNPDLKKEQIHAVQEWLKSQPHLPTINELELIYFLHSNFFDLEGAKSTIDCYCESRANYKELFSNQDILSQEMKDAQDSL